MKNPLATALVILLAGPLCAETRQCDDPLFTVEGQNPTEIERACGVAVDARAKLASCGVVIENPVLVELTDTMEDAPMDCLGFYHCGENRIEILLPKAMSKARSSQSAFALVSDDAYWDSVLVHELAHSVYDTVFCPFPDCAMTAEYVGYNMQVLLLPEDQQNLFGQNVRLKGEPTHEKISSMLYYLAPERFAKYAWLHFQARPNLCRYMRSIMQGDVYFDSEHF